MATKKTKRYDYGGDVTASVDPAESEAKQRGLAESNKEAPVGFFERLRMGNIDDPNSEAYKRFGAGRGRSMVPVEDRTPTPVKSDIDTANESADPIASLNKSRGWTDTDETSASETKPSKMEVAKPAAAKSVTSSSPKKSSSFIGVNSSKYGYSPSKDSAASEKTRTREELIAAIPTGGSGSGPTESEGNSASGSELGRNIKNTLNATAGLAGVRLAQAGVEAATAGRAAAAAKAAKAGEVPSKGRESVTNPLSWMAGPKNASKFNEPAKAAASSAKKATKESKAAEKSAQLAGEMRSAHNPTRFTSPSKAKDLKNTRFKEDEANIEFKRGGAARFAKGGFVARRGDGIAQRGKTKGVMR